MKTHRAQLVSTLLVGELAWLSMASAQSASPGFVKFCLNLCDYTDSWFLGEHCFRKIEAMGFAKKKEECFLKQACWRERQTETEKQRSRDREREQERGKERQRQRDREGDRDRETER